MFVSSSSDGPLGCFQLGHSEAAAVNALTRVPTSPLREISTSWDTHVLTLADTDETFPEVRYPFTHPAAVGETSSWPTNPPTALCVGLLDSSHFGGRVVIARCGFGYIFYDSIWSGEAQVRFLQVDAGGDDRRGFRG